MKKFRFAMLIYCGLLGLLVGLLTAGFLSLVQGGIHLLWTALPRTLSIQTPFYPLIICSLGGLLVGTVQLKRPDYPKTMHETLGAYQKNGRLPYRGAVRRNFIAALIILSLGACAGPEAALVGIVGGMIQWIGDRIQLSGQQKQTLMEMGMGAVLVTVFTAPLASIGMGTDRPQAHYTRKSNKIILYAWTAIFGLLGFASLRHLLPHETILKIRLTPIEWSWHALATLPLAMIAGIIFAAIFLLLTYVGKVLRPRFQKHRVVSACFGGLLLGLAGVCSPLLLFSGEVQLLDLSKQAAQLSVWVLIGLGLTKIALTTICFELGWRGGTIFPAIFGSAAIGFAVALLSPNAAALLVAVTTAASLTVILKRPGVTAGLLLFLFPLQIWPIILAVCYLSHWLSRSLKNKMGKRSSKKSVSIQKTD